MRLQLIGETFRKTTTGALTWAFQSVLEKGLVRTVKDATSAAADLSFDWCYGTMGNKRRAK